MCTFPMCVFALFLAFRAIFQHIRGVSRRLFYNEVAKLQDGVAAPSETYKNPADRSVFTYRHVNTYS